MSRFAFICCLEAIKKKEGAYFYQVLQSVVEMIKVVLRAINILYRFSTGSATIGGSNPLQFLNYSYTFMIYGARLSAYLTNCIITTSLLLSVSMAADRVFALWKPTMYRNLTLLQKIIDGYS